MAGLPPALLRRLEAERLERVDAGGVCPASAAYPFKLHAVVEGKDAHVRPVAVRLVDQCTCSVPRPCARDGLTTPPSGKSAAPPMTDRPACSHGATRRTRRSIGVGQRGRPVLIGEPALISPLMKPSPAPEHVEHLNGEKPGPLWPSSRLPGISPSRRPAPIGRACRPALPC